MPIFPVRCARPILLLMLTIHSLSPAEVAAQNGPSRLEVEATAISVGGEAYLEFSIRNRSGKPVRLARETLPWLCPRSVLILADAYFPEDPSAPLPHRSPPPDEACPRGLEVIAPGRRLSGRAPLASQVEGLKTALATRRVAVFWFWRPEAAGEEDLGSHGGFDLVHSETDGVTREGAVSRPGHAAPGLLVRGYAFDGEYPALALTFYNQGDKDLSIDMSDLPWAPLPPLTIRAGVLDPPGRLDSDHRRGRRLPWTGAWVIIPPKASFAGSVPISGYVRGFEESLKTQDVAVFWLYRPREKTGRPLDEQGGFVIFPRTGSTKVH